jgi:pyruvate/2-oxoglutarate dehydrogenase complex dihydrolipoamide acyltransferase (E2) component
MAVEGIAKKGMEALWGSPSLAKSLGALDSVTALAAVAATAAATAAAAEATTAAAAAAAEAATAATAAESTAGAVFLRAGLIDRQLTASELDAVDLLSRYLGLFGRTHGDEGEAARAARHFVHSDVNVGNGSELAEVRAELVFGRFEREISNV